MDALFRGCLLLATVASLGANYETTNFSVTAPSPQLAKEVGDAAEHYRRELSLLWTGQVMPSWDKKCPIQVQEGNMGAGGATNFNFDRGEVYGWRMRVHGTAERILDSVLPHEVNHTIFACYFRRALPRWADEGAASLIEHESERRRLQEIAEQVLGTSRKIPLRKLLSMKDYPSDQQAVLTLYAEGYSLVTYLMQHGDKKQYLRFLSVGHQRGWDAALNEVYGIRKVEELESQWDKWVIAGSPTRDDNSAAITLNSTAPAPEVRGQSPDKQPPAVAARERRPAPKGAPPATQPPTTQTPATPPVTLMARNEEGRQNMGRISRANLREPVLRESWDDDDLVTSRPSLNGLTRPSNRDAFQE